MKSSEIKKVITGELERNPEKEIKRIGERESERDSASGRGKEIPECEKERSNERK